MIEKGSENFEKIANMTLLSLSNLPQPIPYKTIITSINRCEKLVGDLTKTNEKLSDTAKTAIRNRIEAYFEIQFTDKPDDIVESPKSRNRPKWWTARSDRESGYYISSYLRYLREDPATVKMRNESVIKKEMERTDIIMDKLFDPKTNVAEEDIRGLIMGHVQSGKTANYSMLINKAADAGFRFIIILTGTIELLRQQTQHRISEAFVGEKGDRIPGADNRIGVGKYRKKDTFENNLPICMTSVETDFRSNQRQALQPISLANTTTPLIFVVKKNITALSEILQWLNGKQMSKYPLLMIDDEADAASVSTRGSDDPTKINAKIREILESFDKRAYVGYTATPFANVFIDPLYEEDNRGEHGYDLYPKDFMISLVAPEGYIGAEKIFGTDEDELTDYLIPISDWEDEFPWRQKTYDLGLYANTLPQSLQDAVKLFMMNIAIRDLRGQEDKNNSMLVHISRLTKVHEKTLKLLTSFVNNLSKGIVKYAKSPETSKEYLRDIRPFEDLFKMMTTTGYDDSYGKHWATNSSNGVFQWKSVLEQLIKIAPTVQVGGAFSSKKDIIYPKNDRVNVIGVGGNTLARGFTLEDLSISYFTRNTVACDTLLQMGRWFGYRRGFEDLCRIFIPEDCINNFKYATSASLDLIKNIEKMNDLKKSPDDFLITIARHPASSLVLTAANKSRNATYDKGVQLDGELAENGSINDEKGINKNNKAEALNKIAKLVSNVETIHGIKPAHSEDGFLWGDVPGKQITSFIQDYPIDVQTKYNNDFFCKYLDENSDMLWDVAIISRNGQNSYGKTTTVGAYEIYKSTRKYRKNSNDKRVSMSIKEDECIGLNLNPEFKKQNNLRTKIRKYKRTKPLLLINIVDVFQQGKNERATNTPPHMMDVPLITVTFPGSFDDPRTKPVRGLVWNKIVRDHLNNDHNEFVEEMEEEE